MKVSSILEIKNKSEFLLHINNFRFNVYSYIHENKLKKQKNSQRIIPHSNHLHPLLKNFHGEYYNPKEILPCSVSYPSRKKEILVPNPIQYIAYECRPLHNKVRTRTLTEYIYIFLFRIFGCTPPGSLVLRTKGEKGSDLNLFRFPSPQQPPPNKNLALLLPSLTFIRTL